MGALSKAMAFHHSGALKRPPPSSKFLKVPRITEAWRLGVRNPVTLGM